jgi:hypothetical protein
VGETPQAETLLRSLVRRNAKALEIPGLGTDVKASVGKASFRLVLIFDWVLGAKKHHGMVSVRV